MQLLYGLGELPKLDDLPARICAGIASLAKHCASPCPKALGDGIAFIAPISDSERCLESRVH